MEVKIKEEIAAIRDTADLPDIAEPVEKSVLKLAHNAKDMLGYKPLHAKVVSGAGSRLANVLIELGIEVLSMAAILSYQQKLGRPHEMLLRATAGQPLTDEEDTDEEEDSDEDEEEERPSSPKSKWRASEHRWERLCITEYAKPVPVHVLSKAIQIKQALPMTEFYVEEVRRMPDPFLIAVFEKEQYYIEVWEEPTFEGRTTKKSKR